jgi:hypothetical protein
METTRRVEDQEMRLRQLLAGAALAVIAVPLGAQSVATNDMAEMKAYRLTMDGLRKMVVAGENMARAMANDPGYKAQLALDAEIEALEKKDDLTEAESKKLDHLRAKLEELEEKNSWQSDGGGESLDEIARRVERLPVIAKAIREAGLSPREYTLVSMVTFQVMMVHGMQKEFGSKQLPPELAGTVRTENLKFVADNEAEITRLLEKMKSLEKKP